MTNEDNNLTYKFENGKVSRVNNDGMTEEEWWKCITSKLQNENEKELEQLRENLPRILANMHVYGKLSQQEMESILLDLVNSKVESDKKGK